MMRQKLLADLSLLDKQLNWLNLSYQQCLAIGIKEHYSVVNNAHKRQLIDNVDLIRTLKDIRNTIVHEYIEEELSQLFAEVLDYCPALMAIMRRTQTYILKVATAPPPP